MIGKMGDAAARVEEDEKGSPIEAATCNAAV